MFGSFIFALMLDLEREGFSSQSDYLLFSFGLFAGIPEDPSIPEHPTCGVSVV